VQHEGVAHRAAAGDGDRRVRCAACRCGTSGSLCAKAGLGKLSKSTASRICEELRERFEAFKRRDLYDVRLVALFCDAVFLSVRPDGPKEGVLVAWGFTEAGERVLLSVMLGMRESHEDWLALGRDLIARGLGAPMLIIADGAPGLIKAVEQCWPASDGSVRPSV
jgi:putative transposase